MVGKVASMSLYDGYSVETTLDPPIQPFLHDHQIDGTPVLPGVMGIEAFAEAALCLLPGWQVEAIEDISFLAPFKFYRSEPRVVRIETQIHPHGDRLVADCRLIGYRSLPNQTEPQATTHFTARVRLAKQRRPDAGCEGIRCTGRKHASKLPTSIDSTSTGPRTRWWRGHGGTESASLVCWRKACLPITIRLS